MVHMTHYICDNISNYISDIGEGTIVEHVQIVVVTFVNLMSNNFYIIALIVMTFKLLVFIMSCDYWMKYLKVTNHMMPHQSTKKRTNHVI